MAAIVTDQELAKKIAALDARDKLLRQQMTKRNQMDESQTYIGSCPDMCPERERYLRMGLRLSIFEKDQNNQPDESAMIKEYRRAGADQEEPLPHDLRTLGALERTMDYIICKIMDDPRSKSQELALQWYDFLWDRLRAIRKDITQQSICSEPSAVLVERCARFHVHSCYAMNRIKDFDVDMNKRNLNDCLQMLRQMYCDLRNVGIKCPNELEFQKYDILLHLDDDHSSTNVLLKTSDHRSSAEMKFVTQLFDAYTNNDYCRFFKLFKKADYMTSCILSLYTNKVRLLGLKIIVAACNARQAVWYPSHMLMKALCFDDSDDLKNFLTLIDVEIGERDSKSYVIFRKELITMLRQYTNSMPSSKSYGLVESKMNGMNVGQLVYGCQTLPQNPQGLKQEIRQRHDTIISSVSEDAHVDAFDNFDESDEFIVETSEVPICPPPTEAIQIPEETVNSIGNSPVIKTEEEIAILMPVGRFKRAKLSSFSSVLRNEISPIPQREPKPTFQPDNPRRREIDAISQAIQDEERANKSMLKLVEMLTFLTE